MAYFEWADDLEIDQGPIDQDHRKLVAQVNELHTATAMGRGQEIVGRLLEELEGETVEHIRREEAFLAKIGYPESAEHHQGHERFLGDLRQLRQRFDEGGITVAAQLSQLLRDWLSIHIRRNDSACAISCRPRVGSAHRVACAEDAGRSRRNREGRRRACQATGIGKCDGPTPGVRSRASRVQPAPGRRRVAPLGCISKTGT